MKLFGLSLLRAVAVGGVLVAIGDPGCPRNARPRIGLEFAGEAPAEVRASLTRSVRSWTPWADIVDGSPSDLRVDSRLVAGDAAPLLADLERRPADLALRFDGPRLDITAITAPVRVTAGSRVPLQVRVETTVPGTIRVRVVDAESGATQAAVEQAVSDDGLVPVPWLAVGDGPRRLRFAAERLGSGAAQRSPWVDVEVDVRPASFTTHLIEARPTWVGRFTRLALAAGGDARVTTDVRTAPGVSVRRGTDASAVAEAAADLLIVTGPEALGQRDVARLERLVREAGKTLIVLLDEPPVGGPWRRLWPTDLGRQAGSRTPQPIDVAGARWRTREWLTPATSTGIVPLAYVDKKTPVVLARALGEGRIVMVTALDAWRWRGEADVAWDAGWQALVRRLAADVPPPLAVTAWTTGAGADRLLQVDARTRADVDAGQDAEVRTRVEASGTSKPMQLRAVQARRFRGAARVRRDGPHRVTVDLLSGAGVVARGEAVVHVGAVTRPAAWREVVRHQRARGAEAAEGPARQAALEALRERLVTDDGPRWYPTRTWWYAALVLAALGSEWILRRARRLP